MKQKKYSQYLETNNNNYLWSYRRNVFQFRKGIHIDKNYNNHILEKKYCEKRNTFHEKTTNNNLHVKLCIEYNDEMKLLRSKSCFRLQKISLTLTLNNFYRFN